MPTAEQWQEAFDAHVANHENNIASYTRAQKAALTKGEPKSAAFWAACIADERFMLSSVQSILTYAQELENR